MTVPQLNDLLGNELGRNRFGEGIFAWKFSDDLFWPATLTGRMIEKKSEGGLWFFDKEYGPSPLSRVLKHQWVVTRWYPPDSPGQWESRFPGAPIPERGSRIHTDWANKPHCLPTFEDTRILIRQLKEQLGEMDYLSQLRTFEEIEEKKEASKTAMLADAIQNEFTAGLNPYPGKRGGFVSWQTGTGDSPLLIEKSTGELANG